MRPALFQLESGPEVYQWPSPAAPKRTFEAKLFLYFASNDLTTRVRSRSTPRSTPSTPCSRRRTATLPSDAETLGGAVHDCKITGVPVRDPGDLDGDGLAVVSVRLIGP